MQNEGDKKSNRGLLILFSVLCVVIVGLVVGILVYNNNHNNIDNVISDIEEQYTGDLFSTNGALVFTEYMEDKVDDGVYSNNDVYNFYEKMIYYHIMAVPCARSKRQLLLI